MSGADFQADVERFGRMYAASSHVSRAVMRGQSREELLREVVRVLVEAGKFAMASIAWRDPETNELVPVARFGNEEGYVAHIHVFADERPEGQGPAGTAFREGKPYICNDFLNDPRTLPWRDVARACGWRASAAMPIPFGGKPCGVLSVYALEKDAFSPDLVELLQQVALDVGFGLEYLAAEKGRREAEQALATSEQRLKFSMSAAQLGTFEWDLVHGRLSGDAHHERLLGFAPGSFDGTFDSFAARIHPEDLPRVIGTTDEARAAHRPFDHEFRVGWPDGSEHWLVAQGEWHYTNSGQPDRTYGVLLEVTKRKRAEVALHNSEERLRQAARVSDIGIFDHDQTAETLYWSQELRSIYGLSTDEPVSFQDFLQLIHPDDRGRITKALQRAHEPASDGFFDVEYRLLLRDGSIRWTSTRARTFFEGEGDARHPVRTIGAVIDVTAQKLALEQQQKLAKLVTMTHSFMGIATMEGRVTYLNPAALTMVGLDSDEGAYQKSIPDFFAESHRAQAWKEMSTQLLNTGQWEGESQFRHFQTGAPIDVEILAFHILDDNGAPLYIAIISRNVTARKRAEADEAKLQEQLFQAQKMESVGRLAGGVAHDFNNMLTVINGYSRLLLGRLKTGDPLRDGLEEIRKAGEHAARLTQQLLAFSRKQVRQASLIDLNRVVSEMRPMLTRMVGEDVELCLNLNPEAMTVCADQHQLEQVVMNLVVNSRDAMPHGGEIVIGTTLVERGEDPAPENQPPTETAVRPVSYIVLAVGDNGVGMNEETRRRAFEPFFTTKEAGKGTGLGLSMVHGIVEQSGGCIEIDSEPGHGTTFRIYLPRATGAAMEEKAPEAVPKIGGTETVLVVEDQVEVRKFAAAALHDYGYGVIQADNAGEALSIFERERGRIDLVLTDVVMPILSGRELADRLRKRWPEIKILFMSGYTEDAALRDGLVEGKAEFIQKPFAPEQLARKIRKMLIAPDRPVRILVADDEVGVRSFLRTVLEDGGYEVLEAVNGKQAVEKVRAGLADLLITDLVMPEREGIETIRVLHKEAPGLGIIAISGTYSGPLLSVARLLGADAVLSKPVTPELLLTSVARVLKLRR